MPKIYFTPEEYETAARNGVSRQALYARVQKLRWDKERAISTPPQQKNKYKMWVDLARRNGISYRTFQTRVKNFGWDLARAATESPEENKNWAACNRRRKAASV